MPFVQMENISHFLRACQASPLNLQQHDTFLTVDLFEQKDPAQVLQCLGAFSRAANAANPKNFPTPIGPKTRPGVVTPQGTGPATPTGLRARGASVTSNSSYGGARPTFPERTGDTGAGRWSPTKSPANNGSGSPGAVSSWSRREHEGVTSPAWNIAQYGYMGGASQGNLGIAFGGRRQITNSGPSVPSLADKQRQRREREAEEDRLRQEEDRQRRQRETEEEQARLEEERRWNEETDRAREQERLAAEEEKKRWQEEERQWKLTEEKRRKEEEEAEARLKEDRRGMRNREDTKLRGQFLSQYQAEQASSQDGAEDGRYRSRVQELEKELDLARQREDEYERERQERAQRQGSSDALPELKPKKQPAATPPIRHDSWSKDQREVLRTPRTPRMDESSASGYFNPLPPKSPRPLPDPKAAAKPPASNFSSRPLPDPTSYSSSPALPSRTPEPAAFSSPPVTQSRTPEPAALPPLPKRTPEPASYGVAPVTQSRVDRFLNKNPAPAPAPRQQTYSRELGATSEQDGEDKRRAASQNKTQAGGWASKSLLEREMEMERQRQQEWEESQKETAAAVRSGEGVDGIGGGIGGRWDVSQWSGFTRGDSQNKGAQGIGAGRRQIVGGPRPLPEQPR